MIQAPHPVLARPRMLWESLAPRIFQTYRSASPRLPASHDIRGQGAGPLPGAEGAWAAIAPPIIAQEHPILSAIRCNALLDQIRHSDSALQVLRNTRLEGDLAAITSTLTMSFAKLLFRFMSNDRTDHLQSQAILSIC